MKNQFIKLGISLILGVIIAFAFNYFITSELIVLYFFGSSQLYSIIAIVCLLFQIFVFTTLIYFIITRQCPKPFFYVLAVCYFFIMMILLFGRPALDSASYNLNILELFNPEAIIINGFNFVFFVPIGYFIRKKRPVIAIPLAFALILFIEIIQFITHRGMFDVVDILVDSLAIITGYFLSKHFFNKTKANV